MLDPDEPWLVAFLIGKGFKKVGPTKFKREKVLLDFVGNEFSAFVEGGASGWKSDFRDTDPETIKGMIEAVIGMRGFETEAQIRERSREVEEARKALRSIAETILTGPDCHGAVQLRRFLWSLYNGYHLINLHQLTVVLDGGNSQNAATVFRSALCGGLQESDIKEAIVHSGEWRRWDIDQPADGVEEALDEMDVGLARLIRQTSPCQRHTDLVNLRNAVRELKFKSYEDGQR